MQMHPYCYLLNSNTLKSLQRIMCIHSSRMNRKELEGSGDVKAPISKAPKISEILTKSDPPVSATARLKEVVINVIPKKKEKVKSGESLLSRERNFLTALRAMSEFLLKPSDLENLRKTTRRSPFENEPPITVFWRRDVEAKAIEVWGSLENLDREKKRREKDMANYQQYLFNLKRVLRSYQKTSETVPPELPHSDWSFDASTKVVWTAVLINGANFVMKLGAWSYTGSHSLFAEALHSFADVTNQLILAYGIHKSHQDDPSIPISFQALLPPPMWAYMTVDLTLCTNRLLQEAPLPLHKRMDQSMANGEFVFRQEADMVHPYGYTTMRYVSSLISGAMIFCVGSGLSFQHGISGLFHPSEIIPLYWAFFILGGSLITEGGTLLMAVDAIRKGAKEDRISFMQYVLQGRDPSLNVVLMEDMAAVMGVGVALSCMGLTSILSSHIPDAVGSCIIGGILAAVSGFIIYTNSVALVGRSIPHSDLQEMNNELEADLMIRAIHDVKGIDMGSGFVRYKAEVDFDGRELTRSYLEKQDIQNMLKEMNALTSVEDAESFLLQHGENIVDSLGAEVDRIERKLKKRHPEVRHCDLEIL